MPRVIKRRGLIGLSIAFSLSTPRSPGHAEHKSFPVPPGREEWEAFKSLFVSSVGRVVDTANQDTSHSEGQGWGLLLAESFNDEATFNRLLGWTRRELRRPYDNLHAWAWRPGRPIPVEDTNNATDGDVCIAWALERAANRWQRPELRELAQAIVRDLHRACVREVSGRLVLLPAGFGFEHPGHVVVNPSYYVFPAFRDLARLMPEGRWGQVREDGLQLLREARFGRWGLPADWVRVARGGERHAPAPGWAPRFSYDAVRVPLYLAWAGLTQEPAAQAADRFWSARHGSFTPAWTDFSSDLVAHYPADSGMQAIASLLQGGGTATLPKVKNAPHYYAAALTMLARIAAFEQPPTV